MVVDNAVVCSLLLLNSNSLSDEIVRVDPFLLIVSLSIMSQDAHIQKVVRTYVRVDTR